MAKTSQTQRTSCAIDSKVSANRTRNYLNINHNVKQEQKHTKTTMFKNHKNLALLCDFYEFLMSAGYLQSAARDTICYFDVFFRQIPDGGGFVIASGQESIIEFIKNLHFDASDLAFLREQNLFCDEFLQYLSEFKFSGDIYGVREGEVVFANEPILTICAKASEAQILETFILLVLNHQSLIATKTSRIVRAANCDKGGLTANQSKEQNTKGKKFATKNARRAILEFGSRRAQGVDAALIGARAAYIGGANATACTLAGKVYGIRVSGTMAHSWVQMFESELEAFMEYCKIYPNNAILLIDTYEALGSGITNAIIALKQLPKGAKNYGVRIDSGDLEKLSKIIRVALDDAGLYEAKIIVSGGLNELKIQSLIESGAPIDAFGVGEKLITAKSSPVLGCVYKLVAKEKNGVITPSIKISEDALKTSIPHFKKLYRLFDKQNGKAIGDVLCLHNENLAECDIEGLLDRELEGISDTRFSNDVANDKRMQQAQDKKDNNISTTHKNCKDNEIANIANPSIYAKNLHIPYFINGSCVYDVPSLKEIREYAKSQIATLDSSILSLNNVKPYKVALSENLRILRDKLLAKNRKT